ncbi:MAG: beta-galactosidase trimerization domain-containing protein [Candidatus Omnitrophica bacterium]|nr:beta-galactosidase trimerization domain-containing protein [Candidatus Omnitrophota bacterium]
MLSESNIPFVPYASSFRASSHTTTAMLDENGVLKRGCINDEETMDEFVRQTVERHLPSRQHGTLFYSLGDENAVRGSCLSEHCLHAYRDYLKDQYGDIAALNEEWETDYKSFDEITLLTEGDLPAADAPEWFKVYFAYRTEKNLTDNEGTGEAQVKMGDINDEMRALQNENFARWYDRAAFQNANYLKWCNRFVKAFREIDPHSLTGFEGTDSFTIRKLTTRSRQGGDLDAFVREMEFFGPYEGPANEVVRSIQPKGYYAGNWIGYSMLANQLLEGYWAVVLNGMNTVQWWRWDNLQGYHGLIAPSFDAWPAVKELLEDTQVVRDGLGDLLMECEIQDDGIAMYYSLPSTYIAHFDGNDTYGLYKRDHKIWYEAIHDAGMQFDYVTDRMLRLGEFDIDHYKVLILPLAFAIGEKEAEVIREFVEKGGTVIADVRPGTCDDHCKPLEKGVLDDLFGIERKGKLDAFEIDRMRVGGEVGGTPVSMEWGNWNGVEIYPQMKVDPAVRATIGKPLGLADLIHFWDMKRPVCVVNEVGKGRAILLNFSVYNAPFSGLLEDLLASAGSTPTIEVTNPEGESIPGLEITRWKNGEIELVSLMGHHEGPVHVSLPDNQFVYDLKKGESLGRIKTFKTDVHTVRPSLFALLDRESPRPEIKLESETIGKGSVGRATIRVPGAKGKHALKVTAKTSMGKKPIG